MLRKITLGLLALGVTASALAAHPGDMTLPAAQSGVNLTAPEQAGYWSFGVEALYMEPTNHDANYAITSLPGTTNEDVDYYRTESVNNDYDWGWSADITYHFAGYGRDATLSYTRLHADESDGITGLSAPSITAISEPSFVESADTAYGAQDNDYDSADLTFGQMIDVGSRVHLHPFAGVRWADIDVTDSRLYNQVDANENFQVTQSNYDTFDSEFEGFGPRFGTDASVTLGGGFSLVGRVGISALVGSTDNKLSATEVDYNSDGSVDDHDAVVWDQDSHTRVVPEIDARLGARYGMQFNQGTGLAFEAGWQVTNYFDVVDNSFAGYYDTTGHDSDFGLQGPYVRVQLDLA